MLFLSILFLLLTACSKQEDDMEISEQREHPTADDYMKERNVENERSYTYPLTGERTHDEVKDRIVAVMVNNHEHARPRSEEHTSELQSRGQLVCRLLLEKKKEYRYGHDSVLTREIM